MREWWCKFRAMVTGRRRLPEELREEIEAHVAMEIQENLARGMPQERARQLALRRFGNATQVQERAQEAWALKP